MLLICLQWQYDFTFRLRANENAAISLAGVNLVLDATLTDERRGKFDLLISKRKNFGGL